ncbi:MAG: alpha/beta hydrolase [Acidobacteriaceae bacterium]|nr:alpha/beta hydrolase [Acidobacteriaceae bacterium]
MRTAVASLICLGALLCTAQTTWHDPSPHTLRFVEVQPGVKLEVLDWGGHGRDVVLLAGYLTAHAYDDFAVKLSHLCHVYGITRRGFGASSRPDSGYDAERSGQDILQVIDALKLSKPVLAGHSFGGQDLNWLGAKHSDRLSGLIYLNSAEDATLNAGDYGVRPPEGESLPAALRETHPPQPISFQAYREWQLRVHGVAFPESELRQLYAVEPDGAMGRHLVPGRVRDAMFQRIQKPDYAAIRIPVLAFFATPAIISDQMKLYDAKRNDERTALRQKYVSDLAIVNRHMYDLKKGVPSARLIALPGANFYIFLSNETDLLREIELFLKSPPN